jgi:hypothetical protein
MTINHGQRDLTNNKLVDVHLKKTVISEIDMCPSLPGGRILVTLLHWVDPKDGWKVAISGDDDRYEALLTFDQAKAVRTFLAICDGVTEQDLDELGFQPD